ncbi:hypothetical protein MKK69_01110 [Methylobacterium sp. J-026]|uniref:hypothetical protein n=1 Tax=Methylobacterium sp. J-026 TaxID=2836624 RepID=UPI001FB96835|nr:hypothetical protein [Methylobacterium sp. J-026]MCJ2132679.1 hypothetical protein [Methylobacterium sp. J-026]
MMRVTAAAFALMLAGSPAHAEAANSLHALWETLGACARRAQVAPEAAGSEVTVLFTLKRDGTLQGKPRITYARLVGDRDQQQAFIAATLSAIAGCFPIAITDGLGGAVAGRPIRFRMGSGSRGA